MRRAGATVVDVRYPNWLLTAKDEFYNAIRRPEFTVQVGQYLSTLGPKYPKTLAQLIERANEFTATRGDGAGPNPSRWTLSSAKSRAGRRRTIDTRRSAITGCRSSALRSKGSSRRRSSTRSSTRRHHGVRADCRGAGACIARRDSSRPGSRRDQHREPDRVSRFDRAGRASRATVFRSRFRSSVRRSASRGCWRSGTASSRRPARADCLGIRRLFQARPSTRRRRSSTFPGASAAPSMTSRPSCPSRGPARPRAEHDQLAARRASLHAKRVLAHGHEPDTERPRV